jgi:hypothetical protein
MRCTLIDEAIGEVECKYDARNARQGYLLGVSRNKLTRIGKALMVYGNENAKICAPVAIEYTESNKIKYRQLARPRLFFHRKYTRLPATLAVYVERGPGQVMRAHTRNISWEGMAFVIADGFLSVGSVVTIKNAAKRKLGRVRVVWISKERSIAGGFLVEVTAKGAWAKLMDKV